MQNKFKIMVTLVIGIIVGTLGYVVADNVVSIINASQVGYSNPTKTQKTDVQDAIDELYDIAKNHCPEGQTCETYKAIIYFNPTTVTKCDESDYYLNLKNYYTTNSVTTPTGLDSGCMKWYAFKETSTTYDLILDHNISENSTFNNTLAALNNLKSQAGWSTASLNVRMMKGEEVAAITGYTDYNRRDSSKGNVYLDSKLPSSTPNSSASPSNPSKYYWLFDYTKNAKQYGGKVEDENVNNYWLNTFLCEKDELPCDYVWLLKIGGAIGINPYNHPISGGLRPVITINK